MSNLSQWFGWAGAAPVKEELPDIFPLNFLKADFISIDVMHIFAKIITDVIERTDGLKDEQIAMLWDNCIKSEASDGLVTLLAKAMADRKDLFIVYDKALPLIREANGEEARQIQADYKSAGKSSVGIYISFKNFRKADLVKLYSALEYCTLASLNKSMNLSASIQIKISDLRQSVGLADAATAKTQAIDVATSLSKGKDVFIDAKDTIESAVPDLTAVKESIEYLNQKRSFYLGLPAAYITGEQSGGIGATGEGDTKAIERGLKNYYLSIVKPVLDTVFEVKTTYKSQDFREIDAAMNVLKTFSLTDETLVSAENKLLIINRLLDLPDDAKGDPAPKVENATLPGGNGKEQLPKPGQSNGKSAAP